MECNLMVKRLALVSMVMASAASAQTSRVTPSDVEDHTGESLNRFGINYRAGFNITTKFKHLGGYTPQVNRNPDTIVAQYDDGFIGLDSSGNLGNETQFWNYNNASQYQGDTIVMSSSSAPANGTSKNRENDPQHGLELTYSREFGRGEKTMWGIEGAFNFMDVTINDHGTVFGDASKARYAYSLGGNLPLPPGSVITESYPLLSTIPAQLSPITVANGAITTGNRSFDADIFGIRLGPYWEIPMNKRFSFLLSSGLLVLFVDSEFKYRETTRVSDLTSQSRSGSGSHSKVLGGSYVGGNIVYALSESVSLSAGALYQAAGHYSHVENGRKAALDLGQSYFLTVGLGYSF
ncbi:MAG: hypothetical protein ABIP71_11310 [Verrucomicrobiota bacterium]